MDELDLSSEDITLTTPPNCWNTKSKSESYWYEDPMLESKDCSQEP